MIGLERQALALWEAWCGAGDVHARARIGRRLVAVVRELVPLNIAPIHVGGFFGADGRGGEQSSAGRVYDRFDVADVGRAVTRRVGE